jgi:hypothetical protein
MSNGLTKDMITAASEAANTGTSTSNLYIDIAKQGTGTLTGANVDPKLVSAKADRLLAFNESMRREVNTAAENYLFSAGEIDASWVFAEILRTKAASFVRDAFFKGSNIPQPIVIWRTDIINTKLTVTEEFSYENCIITKIDTKAVGFHGQHLDTLKFWFRFTKCQTTLLSFDQAGQAQGNNVTLIDFTKGTLQAPGA